MRTIVITGASSGIGEALALEYASNGIRLAITGRSKDRLEAVSEACRAKGAQVLTAVMDVRDRAAMASWLREVDDQSPVDLVIANAGVIAGTDERGALESGDAGYELMRINILGVANTVQPLLPFMTARGRGQIGIVSSIAAFVPLSHAPSYSASKAALLNYGKSLRDGLRTRGVRVSVICPGYVDTRLSRLEVGVKPFLMSATHAAKRIANGLQRDREVIIFPAFFGCLTRLSGLLPSWLRRALSEPYRFKVKDRLPH